MQTNSFKKDLLKSINQALALKNKRKRTTSFPEKLEVVLLYGSIRIATDTEVAAIIDIHVSMNVPAYCWCNYEEMMIENGDNIIQFNKIKPFIEYVFDKIMLATTLSKLIK